jgi:hypothetical protein
MSKPRLKVEGKVGENPKGDPGSFCGFLGERQSEEKKKRVSCTFLSKIQHGAVVFAYIRTYVRQKGYAHIDGWS